MRVLDLFSGIGGFSLGLHRAGMETVAFCEIDDFCRSILRRRFPDTPIYSDIHELHAARLRHKGIDEIDVICGGFPCQPFSTTSSGKRRGQKDDRYLWPQMFRLICELRPAWVCGENVTGIDGLALDQVVSDLEARATKSRRLLKFQLVPSDKITGGRASGFLATPTATANQDCPSMCKWPGCRGVEVTPKAWERRMGFPPGWTDPDSAPWETLS